MEGADAVDPVIKYSSLGESAGTLGGFIFALGPFSVVSFLSQTLDLASCRLFDRVVLGMPTWSQEVPDSLSPTAVPSMTTVAMPSLMLCSAILCVDGCCPGGMGLCPGTWLLFKSGARFPWNVPPFSCTLTGS